MIYELRKPRGGITHIRITTIRWAPGSGGFLHYQPGRIVEGEFRPDSMLGEIARPLPKPFLDRVRKRAADAGAPTTCGEQEWRMADLLPAVEDD